MPCTNIHGDITFLFFMCTYVCMHVCVCVSRDLEVVYAIVKKLGQFETSRHVDDRTTHVVSGASRRTINILAATAKGCWILSLEWVCAS